jgi:hypothetical protein
MRSFPIFHKFVQKNSISWSKDYNFVFQLNTKLTIVMIESTSTHFVFVWLYLNFKSPAALKYQLNITITYAAFVGLLYKSNGCRGTPHVDRIFIFIFIFWTLPN